MGDVSSINWLNSIISFLLGFISTRVYNKYKKYEGECLIKGELEEIEHDLDVAGRPNEKIDVVYGMNFINHHPQNLFGENNYQIRVKYNSIEEYNSKLASQDFDENTRSQDSMKKNLHGFLNNPWLKEIHSDPSWGGFIKYLFNIK